MSTPDPKTVREIARKHIRSGRTDIGTTIAKHFGNGALGDEEYVDWYHAVVQAWRVELRAVSWPDEQQPADVVTAEQQQDGAVGRVEAFLEDWPNGDVVWFATAKDVAPLTIADLRTVLAERTALAERVAELEGEREVGVRAVESMLRAMTGTERYAAAQELHHCFADRIEALNARAESATVPTYRGVACWPPIAAPDGLSEPVERSETSGGAFQGNTSSSPAAGLSELCPCGCPKIGDGCNCRFCSEPYPTQQPIDDTNGADR